MTTFHGPLDPPIGNPTPYAGAGPTTMPHTGTVITMPPAGGTTPPAALDPTMQSALDQFKQLLTSWGLGSLYQAASSYLVQGLTSDEVTLKLQDTPEFKARFAGNETRKANGLPVLSPAQYIATEEQYRNILQQNGMPAGFYSSHDDFNNWIGGDVSPTELDQRAQVAKQQYLDAPAENRQVWEQYYGLTQGTAIASILDPGHESLADLQRQASTVGIGGAALQQGINVTQARAQQFADQGTTLQQARDAYSKIAQFGATDTAIGQRFGGQQFGQTQEENSLLLNNGAANQMRDKLYSEESAQFTGHGGADANTVNTGNNY